VIAAKLHTVYSYEFVVISENICEGPNIVTKPGLIGLKFGSVPVVDSPKEYVVNLLANERSQAEEFAVDPVQNRLEAVALARIFAVK